MPENNSYTVEKIAKIVNGQGLLFNKQIIIKNLAIDSRMLGDRAHTLFFAIKAQRNGHHFIANAYQNGIRNFVVSDDITEDLPGVNYIKVPNVLVALQQLTAYHRGLYSLKVIGITGSNGKTMVKEWLYQLLANDFNIVRSPKSYNSQIGVPLSVWQINNGHNLGIFEAGISTIGEMENLAEMIKPTIGILTNIGEAHSEGFNSKAEKLAEKLKLFKGVDTFIYAPEYIVGKTTVLPGVHRFTWSFTQPADLQVKEVIYKKEEANLIAHYKNKEIIATVPFSDRAAIENAVICWATLLVMGYGENEAASRLSRLVKVGMRLQLLNGIDHCSLIDDSYSADISSLSIALDFLHQQNQHPKRTLILSDLQETGKPADELYSEIALLLSQKKVDRLIGVGEEMLKHQHLFNIEKTFFKDTQTLLANMGTLSFNNETILVKGGRKFGLEQVVKKLTQKIHDTVLEINLNALLGNLQFYRSKLPPGVKTMAMVKAFSYGSGSFEIANLLQYHKVDYLAVAYVDEGIALRRTGISLPIMVMSPEPFAFEAMLSYQLEPEIYSLELLHSFLHFLPDEVTQFPVHLKLDTGMHRLGFETGQIEELSQLLSDNEKLKVVSVFTHLVATDDEQHDNFTEKQVLDYEEMYQKLAEKLDYRPIKHVLNTSGITRWSQYHFDMVRLGIGLYGFDGALPDGNGLQTVATLKTTISQIKQLAPGETVGYGRKGKLPNGGQIATVKIGYADGYNRNFGNGIGKMLIGGRLVPTIGAICMDMCMLDVTGVDVAVGDEVIVFNQEHSIVDLANAIHTIPYEILTNVSQRVKRVYYYE